MKVIHQWSMEVKCRNCGCILLVEDMSEVSYIEKDDSYIVKCCNCNSTITIDGTLLPKRYTKLSHRI